MEKIDDEVVYLLRYTGAEWKSVIIILDMSLKEFQLNNHMIYLLLSLCTSRALCMCLILCQKDIKENLQKRVYPSIMEAVRSQKCQSVINIEDDNIVKEFQSVYYVSPLTVASGALNLDLIEHFFMKSKKDSVLTEQGVEVLMYLTEPLQNQRMVDFTRTILRLSRHNSLNLAEVSLLPHFMCLFQLANKWHFKIIELIIDHFKFSTITLAEILRNAASVGHNECVKHLIEANANVNFQPKL